MAALGVIFSSWIYLEASWIACSARFARCARSLAALASQFQKLGLEGIVLRIAFGPFFLSDLLASWAVSGASWDHLGAVLGRLAASWSRPGTTSGRSWAVLGASWGVLAHLGGVLGASWGILEAFRDNFHEEMRFFIDFCSQLRCPKPKKSLIFHWFYKHF